ncbi:MAG: hotdog fold thioesterase [Saprospiraceae bacterium]|nr:hotdog fold thioesterase [Saprospiraceae bacterium]
MIWKQDITLEKLNAMGATNLGGHLGMEFVEIGPDYLIARMPVDHRTKQPFGLLHGGASAALAETIGSVASFLCIDPNTEMAVGVEINCNHLRSATNDFVYGKVTPVRIGRILHVWNIEIRDKREKLVCVSRLTIAVINRKA